MSFARKRRRLQRWIRYNRKCAPNAIVHLGLIRAAQAVDKVLGPKYDSRGMNTRMRP